MRRGRPTLGTYRRHDDFTLAHYGYSHTRKVQSSRNTRERLWAEHLEVSREEVRGDPTTEIDSLWKPIAKEQLERTRRGDIPTHRFTLLPGISKRSGLLLGPLQGLAVDA